VNAGELLTGLRVASEHRGGIRCLRLYRVADAALGALRADVARLRGDERPSDVASRGHVTGWTRPFGEVRQFSLLNRTGRFDDFSSDHDQSCAGKQFHAARRYPALAALIVVLPDAVNVRVNVLGPRAGLAPHEEHVAIRMRDGTIGARVRFHLPIATSTRAEMVLDGHVYHLAEGIVHFVNHGCVHAAANHGDDERIHLSWDQLLTPAAFDAMFGGGLPRESFVPIAEAEAAPSPSRNAPTAAYERIAPNVTRAEASRMALCRSQ
jgi:hypothetical protein